MTQQEIVHRNKNIALMLGWTYLPWQETNKEISGYSMNPGWWSTFPKHYHIKIHRDAYKGRSHNELRFNKDWNWLMEAVVFIENLKDEHGSYLYFMDIKRDYCVIRNNDIMQDMVILSSEFDNKILSVFKCVSDFAEQFNNK
jgi:hypothetical protein